MLAAADGGMHAVAAGAEAHRNAAGEEVGDGVLERHAAASWRTKSTALASLVNERRATGTLAARWPRVSTTVASPRGSWNGGKAQEKRRATASAGRSGVTPLCGDLSRT